MTVQLQIGQKAPDFSLYDTSLKARSLSEFLGKKTVLAFFPGAFTSICTKEMCSFRDSMTNFNNMNAQVVAISVDPPFSIKAWAEQNKLQFPILSDFNRQAIRTYGVFHEDFIGMKGYTAAKRSVFVLDEKGIVRYKWVSENPGIEPPYDEVRKAVEQIAVPA